VADKSQTLADKHQTLPNHFKQEIMQEQSMKHEFNSNIHIRSDIFTANHQGDKNCTQNKPTVMFAGINLGDIMRQTLMEEMRIIKTENELKVQIMGGC
jgi:hypothetical protein